MWIQARSPIYLFYELVDQDADGSQLEGARYYKCYLGNRTIIMITAGSNYNTKSSLSSNVVVLPLIYYSQSCKHILAKTSRDIFACMRYLASVMAPRLQMNLRS